MIRPGRVRFGDPRLRLLSRRGALLAGRLPDLREDVEDRFGRRLLAFGGPLERGFQVLLDELA
jgi:hypothetical protein